MLPRRSALLPVYNTDRPEVHAIVAEMRAVLDLVWRSPAHWRVVSALRTSWLRTTGRLSMAPTLPFNFHLMQCAWTADAIAAVIKEYEAALPGGRVAQLGGSAIMTNRVLLRVLAGRKSRIAGVVYC